MKFLLSISLLMLSFSLYHIRVDAQDLSTSEENIKTTKVTALNLLAYSKRDTDASTELEKQHMLSVDIDGKTFKKFKRLYIRFKNVATGEVALARAIDQKDVKEEYKDEKIKEIKINKDIITLSFGPYPAGEYYLFVRVKKDDDSMLIERQLLTISDAEETVEEN